jgi:hypothetical protein
MKTIKKLVASRSKLKYGAKNEKLEIIRRNKTFGGQIPSPNNVGLK